MNFKFLLFLAIALMVATASAFASPVVLSNPYDVNSPSALTSSRNNGVLTSVCWSDFYYDGSYEITDFHWSGAMSTNDLSALDGFWFSIYDQSGGLPQNIVYSQFVTGTANATANGDLLAGFIEAYDFSLDLSAPWAAAVGTYYFSVLGECSGEFYDTFYWGVSGSQYGADDLQYDFATPGWSNVYTEGDLAWEVTGNYLNVVPEPATMSLFGLGLLGTGLTAGRRKKNN
jgi:hypothetical protein